MGRIVVLCLALVFVAIASVGAITNGEFYEALKDSLEVIEDDGIAENADDVILSDDDDTIDFPGNADDEVDVEYLMGKLFSDVTDGADPIVGRARCRCRRDKCSCCVGKTWKVRVLWKKYKARLSVRHPPSLCFKVPGLGRFARVCVQIYNVNLRRKSLCVRLVGKLNLVIKKFRIRIKLGCVRIPIMTSDWLQEINQGKDEIDLLQEDQANDWNTDEFFSIPYDDDGSEPMIVVEDDLEEI